MINPVLFLLIGVLIIAVVMILYIAVAKKDNPYLNRDKYQARWLEIENGLNREASSTYHMAVLNADKLLDQAMRDCRIKGETMGDRLKSANSRWKNANNVWSAHKVRNQLAHEADAKISYDTAMHALAAFKQALKDLGAI